MPLTCPPDNSIQALVFQCDTLAITKGSETLSSISLGDLFIPITSYYQGNIILNNLTETEISYGNIVNEISEVKFICIFPDLSVITDMDDQVLTWAWLSEDPDFSWNPLGPMMVLTGNDTVGIEPIIVANPWGTDVPARIFIGL